MKQEPILFDDNLYQPVKGENGLYPYVEHTEDKIAGFFGKKGFFLSNGQKCMIPDAEDKSLIYPYSENAYQAAKFQDITIRSQFVEIDFKKAIQLAWELKSKIRDDWEERKLWEMERVLRIKFADPFLKSRLLATSSKYLEETNHWKDTYWGVCNGIGENNLGKILMKIRQDYKA